MSPNFETPILQGGGSNKNGICAIFLTDVHFKTTLGNSVKSFYTKFASTRGFDTLIFPFMLLLVDLFQYPMCFVC